MNDNINEYDGLKLENQLCFPLYAAARKIVSLYTPYLKKLGITYTQYIAFMVLWEKKSVSVGELCERLFLDSGTVTPLVKKLEKDGYITRERSKEDERVVMVRLTKKGEALKDKAKSIPYTVGNCVPLEQKEDVQLYAILYQLLGRLETHE